MKKAFAALLLLLLSTQAWADGSSTPWAMGGQYARFDPVVALDFHDFGIDLLNAYGLTETSAAAFLNTPGRVVIGSVGPPLPTIESKILDASYIDFLNQQIMLEPRGPAGVFVHPLGEVVGVSVHDPERPAAMKDRTRLG